MYHKKNDKRSIESSEMIYTALKELILTHNLHEITVTLLVQKANIGRSTFYRNFDTIEDVLQMKCDQEFASLLRSISSKINIKLINHKGLNIEKVLHLFFSYWKDNSEILEVLFEVNKLTILEESIHQMLHHFIAQTTHSGYQIEHKDYFIAIRTGAIISVLKQWIKDAKKISPKELSAYLIGQITNSDSYANAFISTL